MKTFLLSSVMVLYALTIPFAWAAEDQQSEHDLPDTIEGKLEEPISLNVQEVHVSGLLETIADEFQVNIVLDNRAVAPENADNIDPDAEYVSDGIVQFAVFDGVVLKDALEALLRPLALDYSIQPQFIWVTTPERVQHESFERLITRVYDLEGPYVVEPNVDSRGSGGKRMKVIVLLNQLIPDIVDPSTGEAISKAILNPSTNQLMVHQIPRNIKKVENLLSAIETSS